MKLKLDEHMPAAVVELLRVRGFDVETVLEESLGGRSDPCDRAAWTGHALAQSGICPAVDGTYLFSSVLRDLTADAAWSFAGDDIDRSGPAEPDR